MSVSDDFFLRRFFPSFPLRSFFVSPTHENVDERRGQRTKSLSPLSFNNDSIVGNPLDTHTHTHTHTQNTPNAKRGFPSARLYLCNWKRFFTEGNLEHECLEAFIINGLLLRPLPLCFSSRDRRANSKKLPESSPVFFKLINWARTCRRAV